MSAETSRRSPSHAGGGLGIGRRGGGGWRPEAACSRYSVDLFYPGPGPTGERLTAEAKFVCASCPVRRPCLDFALATRQPYGIWGGTTLEERRDMRRSTSAPRRWT